MSLGGGLFGVANRPSESRENHEPYGCSERHGADAIDGDGGACCVKIADDAEHDGIESEDGSSGDFSSGDVSPGDDACGDVDESHGGIENQQGSKHQIAWICAQENA